MKRKFMYLLMTFLLNIAFAHGQSNNFSFCVVGDMPYDNPREIKLYENLIGQINNEKPVFSLHVGDIKAGSAECNDEYLDTIKTLFNLYEHPLIYTPGDNEWTDCHRTDSDPVEKLSKIREVFFRNDKGFGKGNLMIISQDKVFQGGLVENYSWEQNDIFFATLHVVGSNNNFRNNLESTTEFFMRNRANMQWLNYAFAKASELNSKGLVLIIHADMFTVNQMHDGSGFNDFIQNMIDNTLKLDIPTLLINGDSHRFVFDKPLKYPESRKVIEHFTRLVVFGSNDIHGVKVDVDFTYPQLFKVTQIINTAK